MNSPRFLPQAVLPIAIFFALFPMFAHAGLFAGEESDRNLIQNANFENGTNGWELINFNKGGTMAMDEAELHDGKPTLRIESFGEMTFARQILKVKAHTQYRLSGFIKVKDVHDKKVGGKAGANLIEGMTNIATHAITGTANWREVHVDFNTGDKTEIRVGPALGWYTCKVFGTGWFADMSLTEMGGHR
jgi:Carbohydrate binding domain